MIFEFCLILINLYLCDQKFNFLIKSIKTILIKLSQGIRAEYLDIKFNQTLKKRLNYCIKKISTLILGFIYLYITLLLIQKVINFPNKFMLIAIVTAYLIIQKIGVSKIFLEKIKKN